MDADALKAIEEIGKVMGTVAGTLTSTWAWLRFRPNGNNNASKPNGNSGMHNEPCDNLRDLIQNVKINETQTAGQVKLCDERMQNMGEAVVDIKDDIRNIFESQREIMLGISRLEK